MKKADVLPFVLSFETALILSGTFSRSSHFLMIWEWAGELQMVELDKGDLEMVTL